jgi:hypothetical protein
VIGVLAAVAILVALAFYSLLRSRKQKAQPAGKLAQAPIHERPFAPYHASYPVSSYASPVYSIDQSEPRWDSAVAAQELPAELVGSHREQFTDTEAEVRLLYSFQFFIELNQ